MAAGDLLPRSVRARTACAAALMLALVASCGQKPGDKAGEGPGASAQAIVEAAADPCTSAQGGFAQAICGDPELAPLVGQIKSNLVEAASAISADGAQQMASGQTQWLESTRLACGVGDGKVPLTSEQENCLKTSLQSRAQAASAAVQKAGGYVFQTVEINRAVALPADVSAEFGDLGVFAVTKEIKFPRIEGDTPQIKRFNELMEQRPQRGVQDQTSEVVDYKIAYAGPDLVSVRFQMMESSLGAAHPSDDEKVVTVVMATGEQLKESDIFSAPPARWRAELVRRARADLVKQMRERGGAEDLPQQELEDTAVKVKNWVVTEDALVILFPSESIGPRVLGGFEVRIPWRDLAPLLNPAAPAPIKQS
jgi:hypothetical protein